MGDSGHIVAWVAWAPVQLRARDSSAADRTVVYEDTAVVGSQETATPAGGRSRVRIPRTRRFYSEDASFAETFDSASWQPTTVKIDKRWECRIDTRA